MRYATASRLNAASATIGSTNASGAAAIAFVTLATVSSQYRPSATLRAASSTGATPSPGSPDVMRATSSTRDRSRMTARAEYTSQRANMPADALMKGRETSTAFRPWLMETPRPFAVTTLTSSAPASSAVCAANA